MFASLRAGLLALALLPAGLCAQSLTLRSSTPLLNTAIAIAGSGTAAYVLEASTSAPMSLQIFNVQNPAAPVLLSTTVISAATQAPRNALVIGSTLFVTQLPDGIGGTSLNTSLLALDVSNPAAPLYKAKVDVRGFELELAESAGLLCAVPTDVPAMYGGAAALNKLLLFNSTLQQVSATTIPSGPISICVLNKTAYLNYADPSFIPVDLTVPTAPVLRPLQMGSLSAVSGQLGFGLVEPSPYTAYGPGNLLLVYNLSNPLTPAPAGNAFFNSIGRYLLPAPGGIFTYRRTNPYFTIGGGPYGPLTPYSASLAAPTPVPGTSITPFYSYGAAAVGNKFYTASSNFDIYELGTVTATRPPAAALPLYPNPAHGTLRLPQVPAATPVTISDVLGRPCLQAVLPASGSLDISALPAGLYLVRAGSGTSKLVVE